MERQQDVAQLLVGHGPRARLHAHGRSHREIPPHRFRIEAELRGQPLLRQTLAS